MKRGLLGIAVVAVVALGVAESGATPAFRAQPLPSSFCSNVVSGASSAPDYIIASDDALRLGQEPATMVAAIKFVLAQHGFKAGRYSIGYQSCDDSTPQNPNGDLAKCASNAKAYAADRGVVGVIGAWFSSCSGVELPIVERSPSGPLVLVSPNNTSPGLTHTARGTAQGEPQSYYPAGSRNFVRLVAPDDFQGIAAALLVKKLGLRNVFVLDDQEQYGLNVVGGFMKAARNLRLSIVGAASWGVSQSRFQSVVARVVRAHSAVVLLGGFACPACGTLIKELHSALPKATIIAPDGFSPVAALLKLAGPAADGMYLLQPGLDPSMYGPVGQKLQRMFGRARDESGGAPWPHRQWRSCWLRSRGRTEPALQSRPRFSRLPLSAGFSEAFQFDRNGDMSPSPLTIYRVKQGRQRLDRVLSVSSQLLR